MAVTIISRLLRHVKRDMTSQRRMSHVDELARVVSKATEEYHDGDASHERCRRKQNNRAALFSR